MYFKIKFLIKMGISVPTSSEIHSVKNVKLCETCCNLKSPCKSFFFSRKCLMSKELNFFFFFLLVGLEGVDFRALFPGVFNMCQEEKQNLLENFH